jgi:hypothetical protein
MQMNGMRKVFCLLMAMVLAAFVLPAGAATKSISLTVPGSVTTTLTTVPVTIANTGNSNANSFEIDWTTSPQFTVVSASVGGGPLVYPTTPGLKGPAYSRLIFTNQVPTKTSVTITLNVTVKSACTASSIDWWAYAWTGAPGPASTSFPLPPGPYATSLPLTANCTLGFVTQPTDAFIGSTITGTPFNSTADKVKVLLQQGAPSTPSPGVTVSVNSSACLISGTATTDVNGYASFTTLTSTALATVQGCQLTASASGYSSAGSNTFNIVKPDGTLNCGDSIHGGGSTVYDPATNGPFFGDPGWGLRRGPNANCTVIPYTFTFDPGTNKAGFVADKLGQSIIVEYVLVATPSATVDGWPPLRQSKFAWGPGLGNPPAPGEYIAALACSNGDITGAMGSPLPTIPSVSPYSDLGQRTQYQPNQPALMCAAQQGWTGVSPGMVQFWLKVIDTDGWSEP